MNVELVINVSHHWQLLEKNSYTRNSKNLNHVHKDSKDLPSVIIIFGTDVHGGETVFLMKII